VGIDSSAAGGNYGVGFVDGKDHIPGAVSAPGVPLTSGQILIAYALYGDVNLDGLVNSTDFAVFGANFNTSITGWEHGDFEYNGLVNHRTLHCWGKILGSRRRGRRWRLPESDWAALDALRRAEWFGATECCRSRGRWGDGDCCHWDSWATAAVFRVREFGWTSFASRASNSPRLFDRGPVEQVFFISMNGVIAEAHLRGNGLSGFPAADTFEYFSLSGRERMDADRIGATP